MEFAKTVAHALKEAEAKYKVVRHTWAPSLEQAAQAAGIAPEQVARAVLLHDDEGILMAVLPLTAMIDFRALQQVTLRDLSPVTHLPLNRLFTDCDEGSVPPFGPRYDILTLIDERLLLAPEIYFEPGRRGCLVGVSNQDFRLLMRGAKLRPIALDEVNVTRLPGHEFLVPEDREFRDTLRDLTPVGDIDALIREIDKLPAMPELAHRLLLLRNDPIANARDLAAIVEQDPSLAAQIIRYARSPFFGYRGRIDSLHEAISRVLGFDLVMNMTVGIAAGKGFRIPYDGPLGLHAFWRHGVYSAALMQLLAGVLPKKIRPKPGIAYLAGLLHNFGQLLLGHLFPAHFFVLNKLAEVNPEVPIGVIERRVLANGHLQVNGNGNGGNGREASHSYLGGTLLREWNLPAEIVTAALHHHDEGYRAEDGVLANLAFITDQLLKRHGMGDAPTGELSRSVLTALGLEEDMAESLLERLINGNDQLEQMSRDLAA